MQLIVTRCYGIFLFRRWTGLFSCIVGRRFLEFAAPCFERLFALLDKAAELDSQLQVFNLVYILIERLGASIIPLLNQNKNIMCRRILRNLYFASVTCGRLGTRFLGVIYC